MAENFDFMQFAEANKLSQGTIDALKSEELTELHSLQSFAESFDDDISSLKISVGQRSLLRKAVKSLVKSPTKSEAWAFPADSEFTSKTLQKDKKLNELLEELAKSDGSFKISDVLGGDFKADGEKQGSNAGTGKPLYIKDFVSNNRIVPNDTDEKEIFSGNGSTMVMRSQNTKVRPENVTIPQWVSANMRILKALIERGDIASMESMFDYIRYTEEIGEYFQIYSTLSVMLYDHRYREKQAKEKFRWGTPDYHSVNFYLRPSSRYTNVQAVSGNNKQPVLKDSRGQNICRDYQTEEGCRRRVCKYSHVCSADGCRQNHPFFLHATITKSVPQK